MLGIYVFSLIVGGFFIALSIFAGGGDGEVDFDADMDADFDADFDADVDADADLEGEHADIEGSQRKRYRPWLSFKFYTYAFGFFGLTGLLLMALGRGEEPFGIGLSVAMGLFAGVGASYFLHWASLGRAGTVGEDDMVGTTGRVLLPIKKGQAGKVRVRLGGRSVDLRATTDEEGVVLDMNQECFVLGVEDGVARVVHPRALESQGD